MKSIIIPSDRIGLLKTDLDAHTLGISVIDEALRESGYSTVIGDGDVAKALSNPSDANNSSRILRWIHDNDVSVLGLSYRLDPDDAAGVFRKLMYQLEDKNMLQKDGGPVKKICFAGLPDACDRIKRLYGDGVTVFYGDESPMESLEILGIDPKLASGLFGKHPYDSLLEDFGNDVIESGDFLDVEPVDRSRTKNFGTKKEKAVDRIADARDRNLPPIVRAHAGPYAPDREDAVREFIDWSERLAETGFLDVLSIGTSQLTQSRFGEDWKGAPNGGGVPINSPEEYAAVWDAARPMLVRTYAGTKNIRDLAKMYEDAINTAWHALSLWWFSEIDGRGPNTVLENLKEQEETLRYIASTGKPYEANVPHHFAFRRSDDISYVVSDVLSARFAKKMGIKEFIIQTMLNDPKYTWGVNDLAKARATVALVKELEDKNFSAYLQTRAGLNYLSHDPVKARKQLASVTALMDDIEPHNTESPDIIHVVSYSEGHGLATPDVIDESIKITRKALDSYRNLRRRGKVDDMSSQSDVTERTEYLIDGARDILSAIDDSVDNPYSPEGLHRVFEAGFLPVPGLMYQRDKFPLATKWDTRIRNGRVDIYNGNEPMSPKERARYIKELIAEGL